MLDFINLEYFKFFDSTILAAIIGAIIGALFGGIVTFLSNLIFNIYKERNYRKAFIFKHKLKLLELPTYLEGATYLEDHHGQFTMRNRLALAQPRVQRELMKFSENIENIFAHSNSMYLRNKDIEVLQKLYEKTGFFHSRIAMDGIESLEQESKAEDPLKEIAALYFIEIRKLDGPDENIAYNNGLQVEI